MVGCTLNPAQKPFDSMSSTLFNTTLVRHYNNQNSRTSLVILNTPKPIVDIALMWIENDALTLVEVEVMEIGVSSLWVDLETLKKPYEERNNFEDHPIVTFKVGQEKT